MGIAVSGQTFYTFVLENLPHLGALKAMGAGNWLLARMLFLQAFTVGIIGYGIGLGLASLFWVHGFTGRRASVRDALSGSRWPPSDWSS